MREPQLITEVVEAVEDAQQDTVATAAHVPATQRKGRPKSTAKEPSLSVAPAKFVIVPVWSVMVAVSDAPRADVETGKNQAP